MSGIEPEVRYVTCESGDWCGLYINGKLVTQGHSIGTREILELLLDNVYLTEYTDADMEEMGNSFPSDESDLIINI
jgi:hypothetical protein